MSDSKQPAPHTECLDEHVARQLDTTETYRYADSAAGSTPQDPAALDVVDGSPAQPSISLQQIGPLQRIGRYQVLSTLGSGGFGVVYRALDCELNREVAVKVPHPARDARQFGDAYAAEARTVAGLDHPRIVPVYDVGRTDDGQCYFVSKFIPGGSLEQRFKSAAPGLRQAVHIVADVAEGLHYAHGQGLVHRDIKPANILLDDRDRPLLVDFGLALTEADFGKQPGRSGTLSYMSPEQARGDSHLVDPRSDIYSLGLVLFELLTGKRPYRGTSSTEVLQEILTAEARPPRQLDDQIPAALDRICLQAMAKRPADRYSTAQDFADDLHRWLDSQAASSPPSALQAAPPTRSQADSLPAGKPTRTGGRLAVAAVAGCLALIAFVARPIVQRQPAPDSGPELGPSLPAGVNASLDVLVWNPRDPRRQSKLLRDSGALPLQNGDQIRVAVQVQRPAYLYLIWIDSEGRALPVYPWTPGRWDQLPTNQTPVRQLSLPEKADEGWPMEGTSGMETLLLLAREEPLSSGADLASRFAGLPKQSMQSPKSLVWFGDGKILSAAGDATRGPSFFNSERIDDPVLRTQRLIQERLQGDFTTIRAISFAHEANEHEANE